MANPLLKNFINTAFERFQEPASIFYWPYVLCGFLIVFGALVLRGRQNARSALSTIFDRNFWLSRAVRTDLMMSAVNVLAFDAPMETVQLAVFGLVYSTIRVRLLQGATAPLTWQLPVVLEAAVAALVTILSYDFATYVAHRLSHRLPLLWRFHAVHHSATRLNLFSLYRDHPLDHLVRNVLRGAFTALALAALHLLLPRGTWGATILGVGAGFFIYLPTVHLHHSHVPIHYPRWLNWFLLSPHLHQIHHSVARQHQNHNLGVIFPFWDKLFGTYLDEKCELGSLAFGLADTDPYRQSVLRSYLVPLKWR